MKELISNQIVTLENLNLCLKKLVLRRLNTLFNSRKQTKRGSESQMYYGDTDDAKHLDGLATVVAIHVA